MSMFHTTEVTSYEIPSDNVLNHRLSFAYYEAAKQIKGDMLEVGSGAGRGIPIFKPHCASYTAIDKNDKLIAHLSQKHPDCQFINRRIPPFEGVKDNSFDSLVTLQVIEHIEDDEQFVREIHRVLRPKGKAIISTPNIKLSLSRNPWHIREYTADQLKKLVGKYFQKIDFAGVKGSEKVMQYHEQNRQSVQRMMRFDVLNLQYRLPRWVLQMPYEVLNRMNRDKLMNQDNALVMSVQMSDFSLSTEVEQCLDLFCVVEK
jgi:2-polyprenyl-3-methyl-5-hydroxy-6-metoxy-1,4-benzoquinol methylase